MSAEPDWVTPEGRLRWFSEHGDLNAERDAARADLADLRRRVAVLADEMAETHVGPDRWQKDWDAASRAYSNHLRDLFACPTCGGTAWVDWTDDHPGGICPDCKETT